ncbi:hypothetical protein CHELA40_30223 [Chelatococcus asaccharovorans]|nr:hypothetical protein CHELA17_40193 [Chelatococcus asaccharovorans]CAH1688407.1 hypothetical protein CHELA40_30223 [Chelatococcus asaccharovorans]
MPAIGDGPILAREEGGGGAAGEAHGAGIAREEGPEKRQHAERAAPASVVGFAPQPLCAILSLIAQKSRLQGTDDLKRPPPVISRQCPPAQGERRGSEGGGEGRRRP